MSIKYHIYQNNMNRNCKYIARIIKNDTCVAKDIIQRMLDYGSTITETDIVGVIEVLNSVIDSLLREGERVNLFDLVYLYPVISGTFKDMNDDFDEDRHKIAIKSSAGKKLKRITYKKSEIQKKNIEKPTPLIKSFEDIESETVNKKISSKNIGVVNGRNLKINPTNEDEGLFLIIQRKNIEIKIQ